MDLNYQGKLFFLFSFLFISFFSEVAFANFKEKRFTQKYGKLSIQVPDDWKTHENFLGLPLVFSGPFEKQGRTTLSVTSTGISVGDEKGNIPFDSQDLDKTQGEYFSGRKDWLNRRGMTLLEKIPYGFTKGSILKHEIGMKYQYGELKFFEKSTYLICQGALFHLKTLMPLNQESKYLSVVNNMIDSFKCE